MAGQQGVPHIAVDRCKGCGLCVSVCPQSILFIDQSRLNAKGYQPVTVSEPRRCIGCIYCGLICPDVVITVERLSSPREGRA